MSARDELRARLPKGFVAARDGSAPRFIWSWPIGLALLSVFALAGFFTWRILGDVITSSGPGLRPLHPSTGLPAVVGYWSESCVRDPRGEEGRPLYFAAWDDGTLLWSENAVSTGGRPYRTARVDPATVQALAAQLGVRIEALPEEGRSKTYCDSSHYVIAATADGTCYRLDAVLEAEPGSGLALGPVWRDARALILAAIPSEGEPLALDELNYEVRP